MTLREIPLRHLALGALGLALLAGFGMVVARTGPLAPVAVTVTRVASESLTPALFGIGTVEARRAYLIGPTAAGRVLRVGVDVGDTVKAGQVLAEMDPVDLDARQRSLEAAWARANSAVTAAEALRRDAQARQALAASNHQRYRDLGSQRFVSTSVVDGKAQELAAAQAALDAAEANLLGARQELARLQADQAGLAEQRRTLRMTAPHDGIVTSRDAEPGSTVIAGQPVVRLIEPDSLWIRLRLDQARARGLSTGMAAEIRLRAAPGQALTGKVVRVEPVSDSITEERIAFVQLDQDPAQLTVGELGEITLQAASTAALPVLPNAAIRHTVDGAGVWILRDGRPEFARVTLGESSLDGRVQIRAGLHEGDTVVAYSEKTLSPGARIRIVDQLAEKHP